MKIAEVGKMDEKLPKLGKPSKINRLVWFVFDKLAHKPRLFCSQFIEKRVIWFDEPTKQRENLFSALCFCWFIKPSEGFRKEMQTKYKWFIPLVSQFIKSW